ncbi:MAG: hypothetical protein KC731_27640, partial [Myxococcales bacterium]|nr:hypothetical protein [Myxococcales bacterium]
PPPPPPPPTAVVAPEVVEAPSALGKSEVVALLQKGRWIARDPDSAWHLAYRFDGQSYTADAYPTWPESGRFEILSVEGRRVELRFVDRVYDGKPDEPLTLSLELAEDGNSFRVDERTFQREDVDLMAASPAESEEEPVVAEP